MSRIGKLPINIPSGVTVTMKDNVVTVKGPKGELSQKVDPSINVSIEDGTITMTINEKSEVEQKQKQAFHGLYRALINNMVVGVSQGYKREMELVGVGYRVSNTGNLMEFALGYTHPIYIQLPPEIKVETKTERNKNPATSNFSDSYVQKYVLSVSPNLTRVKVFCMLENKSAESRVRQLVQNNFN